MAQNSEELSHQFNHHNHIQHRRAQQNNNNNRQIIGQSADTPDSQSNDRIIPYMQSESWQDHFELLKKQLREEQRQNPEKRRTCCYRDATNSNTNINNNNTNKNGLLSSNGGSRSKIPVKKNGSTLSTKRKISDSSSSIPRIGDAELLAGSQSVCHVCQLREIRFNLLQLNKEVLEQNDKILRLKDQFLREFFERGLIK